MTGHQIVPGVHVPGVHVLGIRHHGPGSAESVAAALDELRPDAVLVEGPPELTPILPLLADPQTVPPVAGLVYAADEPRRAAFYPLAAFSPEWVATRWALHASVDVAWIDLPAATSLAIRAAVEDHQNQGPSESDDVPDEKITDETITDPIGALAEAAGYDDPERWWEDAVEHRSGSAVDRFTGLREAIAELRRDEPAPAALVDDEKVLDTRSAATPTGAATTAVREAAMRKAVRAAVKAGAQRVAVVCGAWHAPAVDLAHGPSAAADNRLLRGLPKTKVAAAWVPWTAGRLSYESGYGAGVTSPGWYRHLYDSRARGDSPDTAAAAWLVRTARELREQGIAASPAAVVDATRVARTLATLRGRPHPGLAELDDASLAVLADGDRTPLRLVHENLVVGHDIGAVPDDAPMIPLAADLQRRQRACRLKPSAAAKTVTLDLRTEAGRARSTLLHRLRLLGVDWGQLADVGRTTGTFKEAWELAWDPALSIAVVEAGMHGTTVASAAAAKVAADAREATRLPALSELVDACLLADLPTHDVVAALADRAATHAEVAELLAAVEPLARVCRYGNVRDVDTGDVRHVMEATAIRAAVGLPSSAVALADDAALALRDSIEAAHRGLMLLADPDLSDRWFRALTEVTARDATPGLVGGRATRILLDAGRIDRDVVEEQMSRTLSTASDPTDAAGWLDGFLTGDAMILIHDAALLAVVDDWFAHVSTDVFDDLLPLLRRTFAEFSTSERRNIGRALSRRADDQTDTRAIDWNRAAPAYAATAHLIGWESA
ncbi:DUF5682 family protein [Gordonia sp. HY002]|uniref:DUF5682 family protein n=1 Tax=Gordonia zhenghanii TaxID=2911516 RepID=UPI001F46360F|nr:DUF5682 family protein [Gordonia zhenghanii]MCF8570713.1 DUF5682 family protein [Gordonia zhenghanii]